MAYKLQEKDNLLGKKFNRLTVIKELPSNKHNQKMWICLCECGNETIGRGSDLRDGTKKSCGCLLKEKVRERIIKISTTHGKSKTVEWQAWVKLRQRCYWIKDKRYSTYGARGIKVCDRWLGKDGFSNFFADMGIRPSDKHSIDRINNDGNYEKDNCKWSTDVEQASNRTTCVFVEVDGISMHVRDAIKYIGVCSWTYYKYRNLGFTAQQIKDRIKEIKKHDSHKKISLTH